MTLNEYIAFLTQIREKWNAGDMPVRVSNVHSQGTSDLNYADIKITDEREYQSDKGDDYVVVG